jgi:hypothetical protein
VPNRRIAYVNACKAARIALLEDIQKKKKKNKKIWLLDRAIRWNGSVRDAHRLAAITKPRLVTFEPTGTLSQAATEDTIRTFYNVLLYTRVGLVAFDIIVNYSRNFETSRVNVNMFRYIFDAFEFGCKSRGHPNFQCF